MSRGIISDAGPCATMPRKRRVPVVAIAVAAFVAAEAYAWRRDNVAVQASDASSCILNGDPVANGLAGALSSGVSAACAITGGTLHGASDGDASIESRTLTREASAPLDCDFTPMGGVIIVR